MKITITKSVNDETVYETIENVVIMWIEHDEEEIDKCITSFYIRSHTSDKIEFIDGHKITIA